MNPAGRDLRAPSGPVADDVQFVVLGLKGH